MRSSKQSLTSSSEFRILLCLQVILVISTATFTYFTVTHCLKSCESSTFPYSCMSQGDLYCCQTAKTSNCQSCQFQNTHCLQFMVCAVVGGLLSLLLMVYLIWIYRNNRKNKQRSLLSNSISSLVEPQFK